MTVYQRIEEFRQLQAEIIRMSLADHQCSAQALLNPPEPAPAMLRAFAKRDKLL